MLVAPARKPADGRKVRAPGMVVGDLGGKELPERLFVNPIRNSSTPAFLANLTKLAPFSSATQIPFSATLDSTRNKWDSKAGAALPKAFIKVVLEVRSTEVRSNESRVAEIRHTEVRPNQVRRNEVRLAEIRLAEVNRNQRI
jgi:hypothetical protein